MQDQCLGHCVVLLNSFCSPVWHTVLLTLEGVRGRGGVLGLKKLEGECQEKVSRLNISL